jgi:hypothetical protein
MLTAAWIKIRSLQVEEDKDDSRLITKLVIINVKLHMRTHVNERCAQQLKFTLHGGMCSMCCVYCIVARGALSYA